MYDNQNDFDTRRSKGVAGGKRNIFNLNKMESGKNVKIDSRGSIGIAGENETPEKEDWSDFLPFNK